MQSPYVLFQERIARDDLYPWRMLVACVLLNRTTGSQVETVFWDLMELYKSPEELAGAKLKDLEMLLMPLGLWRVRAESLKSMSRMWHALVKSHQTVRAMGKVITLLPGVGKYAEDSWRIFVEGDLDVCPEDKRLRVFLWWARMNVDDFTAYVKSSPWYN